MWAERSGPAPQATRSGAGFSNAIGSAVGTYDPERSEESVEENARGTGRFRSWRDFRMVLRDDSAVRLRSSAMARSDAISRYVVSMLPGTNEMVLACMAPPKGKTLDEEPAGCGWLRKGTATLRRSMEKVFKGSHEQVIRAVVKDTPFAL